MADLSQRLLDAADAIAEFNESLPDIYTADAHWRPSELRVEAAHLSTEESQVAALARDMWVGLFPYEDPDAELPTFYVRCARVAVSAGWVKS